MIRAVALAALVVAQAAPAPTDSAANLPEIGRVRASTRACAAINDLVIPSYVAMSTANAKFSEATPYLAKWAENAAGQKDSQLAQMYLQRIGQDVAQMYASLKDVAKALGDPKLVGAPGSTVDDERRQLDQMYVTQMMRVNTLNEFYIRHSVAMMKSEDTTHAFDTAATSQMAAAPPPYVPDRTAFGQPQLSGAVDFVAKRQMSEWAGGMTAQVRASANVGSRFFLPLAQNCRNASAAPPSPPPVRP